MNKYQLADKSKLLSKKLEKLADNFSGKYGNQSMQTREAYIAEATRLVHEFYRSIVEPQLSDETIDFIRQDDLPDADLYNLLWEQLLNDLTTVFTELENVEDLTVANFNFITTEANRLTSKLKSVDSKLGDYILFSLSLNKDVFFYKDSFNDLSKVDVHSALLNKTECTISQAEGIVTLPASAGEDSLVIVKQLPIINPNSNGVVGNNYEVGASFNGNLAVLLDNNPDTWFEYERVTSRTTDTKEALVLDLTMNLGNDVVVNFIRINPNNFGTKTVIQIDDIGTSLDGQVYTSIKDDIPIAGFTTQDEENVFALAPSTSKFAGQGLYTFTPRKARYIHFVFRQTEPYIIETAAGDRLRYTIGLRDIDVRGLGYENEGEFVSQAFESTREIRKVILETNQNPTRLSELASIQYFISPDDGSSWHEIQPKKFDGPTGLEAIPEVLSFNTGDTNAIITSVPVKSLRLKGVFTRDDTRFQNGASSLYKKIINTSEPHEVPQVSPFSLTLNYPPVDGTVSVIDPLFGSRGIPEAQYIIGHASEGLDFRKYRLPFKRLPRPVKKISDGGSPETWHLELVPTSEFMHIEIGGEEWTHGTQALSGYSIDFNDLGNYKRYTFNPNNGVLEFGDGFTNTLAPGERQPVTVYFEPERLFPSESEDAHVALLDFPTSNNRDDFTIEYINEDESYTETLTRKATVIRLANQNISDTTGIETTMGGTKKTYLNGKDELSATGHWSIDTEEGIIYTYDPTPANVDLVVTYTYTPITELTTDDWDWATSTLLRDSVYIKETAWKTNTVNDEVVVGNQNIRVMDLSKLSVVKGTLELSVEVDGTLMATTNAEHPFVKETDYIDGRTEIAEQFSKAKETIPTTAYQYSGNILYFGLQENISTKTSEHPVVFSNTTVFETAVASRDLVLTTGDYYVERDPASANSDYSVVYFYSNATVIAGLATIANLGTVTYYYASANFTDAGLYSVDYKLGRIYTQRPVNPNNDANYFIYFTYQYTNYRAKYKIARLLDENSYDVDITNQTIVIKDNEVLKHLQVPHSSLNGRSPIYLVNYDYVHETREDILDLKTKFTPVLKDYALKILTKGSVV